MALSETTKAKFVTIAENQQGVYNAGVEAGKKAQYDEFWDAYQNNGNRTDYQGAFWRTGWKKSIFKPKYDIRPTNTRNMFYEYNDSTTGAYDLAEYLDEIGIKLDISKTTLATYMFYSARFSRLPELDTRNLSTLESMFRTSYLEKIDRLILKDDGSQSISIAFLDCSGLKDILIEGVIGTSFAVAKSPFSVESLKSIITHLKDYTGLTDDEGNTLEYAYTVTFKSSAFAELEAEGATSPNGNTWAEYIDDLKWNLTLA